MDLVWFLASIAAAFLVFIILSCRSPEPPTRRLPVSHPEVLVVVGTVAALRTELPKLVKAGVEFCIGSVLDKEPALWPKDDDGLSYYFEENFWGSEEHGIRPWLWQFMDNPHDTDNLVYASRAAADKALKEALMRYAEHEAGRDRT